MDVLLSYRIHPEGVHGALVLEVHICIAREVGGGVTARQRCDNGKVAGVVPHLSKRVKG